MERVRWPVWPIGVYEHRRARSRWYVVPERLRLRRGALFVEPVVGIPKKGRDEPTVLSLPAPMAWNLVPAALEYDQARDLVARAGAVLAAHRFESQPDERFLEGTGIVYRVPAPKLQEHRPGRPRIRRVLEDLSDLPAVDRQVELERGHWQELGNTVEDALNTISTHSLVRGQAFELAQVVIDAVNRDLRKRDKVNVAALIYAGLHLMHAAQEAGQADTWQRLVAQFEQGT